jgi:osmotically-inducible protein OsmY
MTTDTNIKRDVESELQWDPSLDHRGIGVIVHDGVVILTGEVSHFSARWAAEDIAKRVNGVRAIANDVRVNIPAAGARSDADVATAAASALQWNIALEGAKITPMVVEGWITLSGQVQWGYQRAAAEIAVRNLMSVKGVTNDISVVSKLKTADVKQKIECALMRHAILDAKEIEVSVDRSTVTLNGHVHTWREHEDAETAAWAGPGVDYVENRLSIR